MMDVVLAGPLGGAAADQYRTVAAQISALGVATHAPLALIDSAEPDAAAGEWRDCAAAACGMLAQPGRALVVFGDWRGSKYARLCAAFAAQIARPVLGHPGLAPVALDAPDPDRARDRDIQVEEVETRLRAAIGQAADQAAMLVARIADTTHQQIEDDKTIIVPAGVAANVAAVLTNTLAQFQAAHRRPGGDGPSPIQVLGLTLGG